MHEPPGVFLDANVLVYFLDETAAHYEATITQLQALADDGVALYTSHHVIEEVLFIVYKLSSSKDDVTTALATISALPNLGLIEPPAALHFAVQYTELWRHASIGINDALLLQLIREAGDLHLFTYDRALCAQAADLGISCL